MVSSLLPSTSDMAKAVVILLSGIAATDSIMASASTKWSIWADSACTSGPGPSQSLVDGQCYAPSDFCGAVGLNSTVCTAQTQRLGMSSFKESVIGAYVGVTAYNCTGCTSSATCATSSIPLPCGQCLSTSALTGAAAGVFVKVECANSTSTTPGGGATKNSVERASPLVSTALFAATFLGAFIMVL
ncbi:hypothetical protein BSLG_007829 [Batrachochytrium salamandrivorans]|nr:hypothetical protein BSLG_007829 [Batrachochytrium salamandrivorans]